MRYSLLETLREYGAERLTDEERIDVAQRHLAYYVAWMDGNRPEIGRRTLQQYLGETQREHDNLRVALDGWVQSGAALNWMLTSKEPRWEFFPMLSYFWMVRGYTSEGRRRLAQVLALPGRKAPQRRGPASSSGQGSWRGYRGILPQPVRWSRKA